MSKTDLNEFKSVLPAVKKMIRNTLKVDAGSQNALDIVAASRGYSGYHQVKAISNLPHYELRANMGSREKPFFVTLEVGHWLERSDADLEARDVLKGCQQFQTWLLYRDGENTHIKYETAPEIEKGFVYQIEVEGHTLDDVEQALDEVNRRLDNVAGFDRNETGSFSFRRAGEEYDFTEDTLSDMDLEMGPDGLIFDEDGVILARIPELDDAGDLDDVLSDMGGRPEYGNKTLYGGESVPEDELLSGYNNEFDTGTYHLFGMKNEKPHLYFKGNVSDVVEHLKSHAGSDLVFWVYEEMGMSEPESDDASFLEAVSGKVLTTGRYALIDDRQVIYSSDDEQKIEEMFNFAHDDIENWQGTLYEAYQITPEQLVKARNENAPGTFIAVSKTETGTALRSHSGSPGFIVEVCMTKDLGGKKLTFFKQVRSL